MIRGSGLYTMKHYNIYVMRAKKEKSEEKGQKKYLKEWFKKFSNMMENIHLYIQEAKETINTKRSFHRYIKNKELKEKIKIFEILQERRKKDLSCSKDPQLD